MNSSDLSKPVPVQTNLENRFEYLEGRLTQSQNEVAEMRQQLDQLRALISVGNPGAPVPMNVSGEGKMPTAQENGEGDPANFVSSRRNMLKRVALAAAGGAAGLSLILPEQAKAATGGNFLLGESNTATSSTVVTNSTNSQIALQGISSGSSSSGVYGKSGAGSACYGVSGASTAGTGVSGFSSTGSGSYGYSVSAKGVYGKTSSNVGVYGTTTGSGYGVVGVSTSGYGVYGTTTGQIQAGIWGNGAGTYAVGGLFEGRLAAIVVSDQYNQADPTLASNPNVNQYFGGEILGATESAVGLDLWYCTAGQAQGVTTPSFRKLAGPGTAGSLHLLATPTRYIDTRSGSGYAGAGSSLQPGVVTPFNLLSINSGTIPNPSVAVFGRFTLVTGSNQGNLKLSNANPPATGSGISNFLPNIVTNTIPILTPLDQSSGNVGNIYFLSTATTDLIVDILGYYR